MSGTHRDPEIAARQHGKQVKQAADDAAGLTMSEWLTRRAKAHTVIVTFPDDEGDRSIEMQIPSWGHTCELTQMESMMATTKGHNRIAEIMNELCQTPSLDLKFWKSGAIGLIDMRHLIEGLTSESLKSAQQTQAVQSFRSD